MIGNYAKMNASPIIGKCLQKLFIPINFVPLPQLPFLEPYYC